MTPITRAASAVGAALAAGAGARPALVGRQAVDDGARASPRRASPPSSGTSSAAERGRRCRACACARSRRRRPASAAGRASPSGRRRRAGRSGAGRGRRRGWPARSRRVFERGRPAQRCRAGGAAPLRAGAEAFCMMTTSSQRPNFQPAERMVPTWLEASARCTPIEPALAESPMTASICRAPARLATRQQLGQQQPAEAAADAPRARGRPSPRGSSGRRGAAGTARRRRSRSTSPSRSRTSHGRPLPSTSARRRAISARSGGSISKVPVPCSTCQA